MDKEEKKEIKMYPFMSSHRHLIEHFSIIGYEESLLDDLISSQKRIPPAVISTINSIHVDKELWSNSILVDLMYSNMPKIINNQYAKPSSIISSFCFNNKNGDSKNYYSVYCYLFYEKYRDCYYIPKVFCIISQYPFFSIFKILCEQTLNYFTQPHPKVIPIEFILYCIVTYFPSPLNNSIDYSFFKVKQQIKLQQISGYPYVDFNLPELFNFLPLTLVIEIFCLTMVESHIVFFSENVEVMNVIMYIFYILNYPCNDSGYFWHIVSVSKDEYLNDLLIYASKPGSFMLGVNGSYEDISNTDIFKIKKGGNSFYVVDLDNRKVIFKQTQSQQSKRIIEEEENMVELMSYIEMILKEKNVKSQFLKGHIIELMTTLDTTLRHRNPNYPIKEKPKYVDFFCSSIEIQAFSRKIQEVFYNFNLNIMKIFYENKNVLRKEEQKKGTPIVEEDIESNKALRLLNRNITKDYSKEEIIFYKQYTDSWKYDIYFNKFIQQFKCLKLYEISLLFSERFLYIKRKDTNNQLRNLYFDIIDNFYTLHPSASAFFDYQSEFILKIANQLPHDIVKNDKKPSLVQLNRCLLFKFITVMNDMTNAELETIFPFYTLILEDLILPSSKDKINKSIESKLIALGSITNKELALSSILYFFSMSLAITQCEMYHLDMIKKALDNISYCARNNLYALIRIIYKLLQIEKNKQREFNVVPIYYCIINYIRNEFIIPDESMMKLLNDLNKEIDAMIEGNLSKDKGSNEVNIMNNDDDDQDQKDSNDIIEDQFNDISKQYKIITKFCTHRNGHFTKEELITIACKEDQFCNISSDNLNLNKVENKPKICFCQRSTEFEIRYTNKNYKIPKNPKLAIQYDNKEIEADFYSPCKLYEISKQLFETFIVETDIFNLQKDLLIPTFINALFYSENLPFTELPQDILASTLLKVLRYNGK